MGKVKPNLKFTLNFNDETTLKYVVNAYGLFCKYRQKNGQPNISLENWAAANMIEAARQWFEFHSKEELKKDANDEKSAKVLEPEADKV